MEERKDNGLNSSLFATDTKVGTSNRHHLGAFGRQSFRPHPKPPESGSTFLTKSPGDLLEQVSEVPGEDHHSNI